MFVRRSLLHLLFCFPIGIAAVDASQPASFTDPNTGLSFTVPTNFILTRYVDAPTLPPNLRAILPGVLVLVERRLDPTATPIALGSLPTISLDVLTGARAQFNQIFLTPQFETTIGGRTAYELPATHGPTSQQLFYYLVPLTDGALLEIAGHRYYLHPSDNSTAGPPTHYDAVIATLLRSLAPPHSKRAPHQHHPPHQNRTSPLSSLDRNDAARQADHQEGTPS